LVQRSIEGNYSATQKLKKLLTLPSNEGGGLENTMDKTVEEMLQEMYEGNFYAVDENNSYEEIVEAYLYFKNNLEGTDQSQDAWEEEDEDEFPYDDDESNEPSQEEKIRILREYGYTEIDENSTDEEIEEAYERWLDEESNPDERDYDSEDFEVD
jgi:hypothetical protein